MDRATLDNVNWNPVDAMPYKGYVDAQKGYGVPMTAADLTHKNPITMYYPWGGFNFRIQVSARVNGVQQPAATTTVTMKAPQGAKLDADQDVVTLGPNGPGGDWLVQLGNPFGTPSKDGIVFNPTYPETTDADHPPEGAGQLLQTFVQNVQGNAQWRGLSTSLFFLENGKRLLDKDLASVKDSPYDDLTSLPSRLATRWPGAIVTRLYGSLTFHTYIVWKSDKPGSIPVHLRDLTWTYQFDVTRSDIGMTENWVNTPPATKPGDPSQAKHIDSVNSQGFVEWDDVFSPKTDPPGKWGPRLTDF